METIALFYVLTPILFIGLAYLIGSWREWAHLRSLDRREAATGHIVVTNLKQVTSPGTVGQTTLVLGEAVIATDYFKTFAASLRKLVGGEVRSFEILVNRARREATLRMIDQARQLGASEVWNVRYETSNILGAMTKAKAVSVEVLASGTAVVRRAAD